jgi:hypothetical protein
VNAMIDHVQFREEMMGIFSKLFAKKKSVEDILTECMLGILDAYKLNIATDAQRFRCLLAISVAMTGILNDLGKGRLDRLIDEVTNTARRMTVNLRFRIRDVAANENELQTILSNFPAVAEATADLRTNGTALFPILFNSLGPNAVKDIMENTGGPMGATGYAAIVVGDLVVGSEQAKSGFMGVSLQLMRTTQEIIDTLK